MDKYVQYINACFGFFPCTKQIKEYNVEEALEEVISLNNKEMGIQIIGFRFFQKEEEKIIEQTGIYYLDGEYIMDPSKDTELVEYFRQKGHILPDFPVIKISDPFLLVYPFLEKDKIIEASMFQNVKEKVSRKKELLIIRKEIEECKKNILQELYRIIDAVETERFEEISFHFKKQSDNKEYLGIFTEEWGIKEYIEYLRKRIDEINQIQNPGSEYGIYKE